jgi:protein-disulfide isomerase
MDHLTRRNLLALPLATAVARAQGGKYEGPVMTRVKVEVFSDFQCPGCKALHESTIKQVRDEYVASGRIHLVHREFPLPMHPYAREAALLACASEKLGWYRKVSDALFQDQPAWSTNGQFDVSLLKVLKPAELAKLRALSKDASIAALVESDLALGKKLPVTQTPTTVVSHNGKTQIFPGGISFPIFKRYVDMLLATP